MSTISDEIRGENAEEAKGDAFSSPLVFILGLLTFIQVDVVGQLYPVEIIFFCIALFVAFSRQRRAALPKFLRLTFRLLIVWLVAQVATDIYRATPFVDYARGWVKIIFLGTNIVAIAYLTRNSLRGLMIFVAGFSLGSIIGIFAFPNVYFELGRIWKFGYGGPVTTLGAIGAASMASPGIAILIMLTLTGINAILDFRSMAGFCFSAAVLVMFGSVSFERMGRIPRLLTRVVVTTLIGLLVFSFVRLYMISQEEGIGVALGEWGRGEAGMNPLYGRLEFIVGLTAAMDSPIIGHGSWAKDYEYSDMMRLLVMETRGDAGPVTDELIPSHSYLVGAWVEAGILGVFFWAFVLFRGVRSIFQALRARIGGLAFIGFYLTSFLWAILFSPFGATERIFAAISLVIIAIIESTVYQPAP